MATPTISSISPLVGQAGDTVTITGTNLTGATAVSFGGAGGFHIVVKSATKLYCVVPQATSVGAVNVTVTTPGGTSDAFSWQIVGSTSPAQFYLGSHKLGWNNRHTNPGIPVSALSFGAPSGVLDSIAYPVDSALAAAEITPASEDTEFRNAHGGMGPIEYGSR